MENSELNINAAPAQNTETPAGNETPPMLFKFSIAPLLLSVYLKWRWILAFFLIALTTAWICLHYAGKYSLSAWTATAKIFHQTRSERIPTFYKPMETSSVAQMLMTQDVFSRVASRMSSLNLDYKPEMLSYVEIVPGRGRENIITINASASTAETAAAIANAVAEVGVDEYVRRQNDNIHKMILDRQRQRADVQNELLRISEKKKSINSPKTGLPPDLELERVREEISDIDSKKADVLMRIEESEIKIGEIAKALKTTPREEVYDTTVDNTSTTGLKGKQADLERLRKRYTEDNPKIKILVEEIEDLQRKEREGKEQSPAIIKSRKSFIYDGLETQGINLAIEKTTLLALLTRFDAESTKKRAEINALLEKNYEFATLTNNEKLLHEKAIRIEASINDLEFIVSTAVPDVDIFERAKIPGSSNIRKVQVKVIALGVFLVILFIITLAAIRIAKLKLLSSSEYKLALGVENLGEIPQTSQYSKEIVVSALQKVYSNIFTARADAKTLLIIKYQTVNDFEEEVSEIFNISATQGFNVFRLRCSPLSLENSVDKLTPEADDEVAAQLVSVSKFANMGTFFYQNDYTLDAAEVDLLRFDLETLSRAYDVITVEVSCDERNGQAIAQISALTQYAVIFSSFDTTSKVQIYNTVNQIIEERSSMRIGGVLADIPNPYYKK